MTTIPEGLPNRVLAFLEAQGGWQAALDHVAALEQQVERLQQENARLAKALVEARRWIGDGDLSDGLHRDHWTPEYAAAVDIIDAAIAAGGQP